MLATHSQWQLFKYITWLAVGITLALSIFAGYRLWRVHAPSSVDLAKRVLWVIGPVASLLTGLAIPVTIFSWAIISEQLGHIIGVFIASCIGAAVWTIYLSRSVRVRNTYNLATVLD